MPNVAVELPTKPAVQEHNNSMKRFGAEYGRLIFGMLVTVGVSLTVYFVFTSIAKTTKSKPLPTPCNDENEVMNSTGDCICTSGNTRDPTSGKCKKSCGDSMKLCGQTCIPDASCCTTDETWCQYPDVCYEARGADGTSTVKKCCDSDASLFPYDATVAAKPPSANGTCEKGWGSKNGQCIQTCKDGTSLGNDHLTGLCICKHGASTDACPDGYTCDASQTGLCLPNSSKDIKVCDSHWVNKPNMCHTNAGESLTDCKDGQNKCCPSNTSCSVCKDGVNLECCPSTSKCSKLLGDGSVRTMCCPHGQQADKNGKCCDPATIDADTHVCCDHPYKHNGKVQCCDTDGYTLDDGQCKYLCGYMPPSTDTTTLCKTPTDTGCSGGITKTKTDKNTQPFYCSATDTLTPDEVCVTDKQSDDAWVIYCKDESNTCKWSDQMFYPELE